MKPSSAPTVKPLLLALSVLLLLCPCLAVHGATYYLDASFGDDAQDGATPATAWATLSRVNAMHFSPGDTLLLKRGCRWNGQLAPHGSGTAGKVITIDAYGDGSLPVIHADGASDSAVALYNQSYWTVQNLEITNDAATPAVRSGVLIQGINAVAAGITLQRLFIHHVNGISAWGNDKWANAGIRFNLWQDPAARPAAYFQDVLVDNCVIQDVHEIGLLMLSNSTTQGTGIVVSNNLVERTGADGIVLQGARGPRMVGNRCLHAGQLANDFHYIAGIWPMGCDSPVIEGNEVAYTAIEHTGSNIFRGDSQGFDIDNGCTGTPLIQYNYSHDNCGGFVEVMANNPVDAIVVRYNISVDDGRTNCAGDTTFNLLHGKVYVYNNVIYDGNAIGIVTHDIRETYYQNNIFWSKGACQYGALPQYSHNCYFGHASAAADPKPLTLDPQFTNPGSDAAGLAACLGYRLKQTSPCLGRGAAMVSDGGRDFFAGVLTRGLTDIGAAAITASPSGTVGKWR